MQATSWVRALSFPLLRMNFSGLLRALGTRRCLAYPAGPAASPPPLLLLTPRVSLGGPVLQDPEGLFKGAPQQGLIDRKMFQKQVGWQRLAPTAPWHLLCQAWNERWRRLPSCSPAACRAPGPIPPVQVQGDKEFARKMEEFATQQAMELQKKREVGARRETALISMSCQLWRLGRTQPAAALLRQGAARAGKLLAPARRDAAV